MATPDDSVTNLSVAAPGGWAAAFSGKNTTILIVILFVIIAGVIINFAIQHETSSQQRSNESIAAMKLMTAAIEKTERTQRETTEGMIWILSKPQAEREKLDLSKPRFVADMQR